MGCTSYKKYFATQCNTSSKKLEESEISSNLKSSSSIISFKTVDLLTSIDLTECLLRNPLLSQSCRNVPVDNMDTMPYSGGRMLASPNFLEVEQSDFFTAPFNSITINEERDSPGQDDAEAVKTCNFEDDFSMFNCIENALDPSMYINQNLHPVNQSEIADSCVIPLQNGRDDLIDVTSNTHLPSCGIPTAHASLPRQYSLNVAIEVLNARSPSLPPIAFDFESNPSFETVDFKSFCNYRNRTMSEVKLFAPDEIDHYRTRAVSADIVLEKSVPCSIHFTDSAGGTTDAGSEKVDMNEHATFTEITSTDVSENVPSLESVPSFMREMNEYQLPTICEDSLDMNGMLDEFLNSNESALNVGKNPKNSSVQINNAKVLSKLTPIVSGNDVVDLTELEKNESVPAMVRSASYKRKRNQNNKACRESRKKRKLKQVEAEETALRLENENAKLRKEILELEVQVNEVRSRFIQLMSNKITGRD